MPNKVYPIKKIFIKRMMLSTVAQFITFVLLLFLIKDYFYNSKINTIADNLTVNDAFTMEEVGKYQILNNKYALDLALSNIEDDKALDSIQFVSDLKGISKFGSCQDLSNNDYQLCKAPGDIFYGISPVKYDNNTIGYIIAGKQYHLLYSQSVLYDTLLILVTLAGVFVFNFLILFLSIKNRMENNTKSLLGFISNYSENSDEAKKLDILEYKTVADKFLEKSNEITKLQNEKLSYEAKKTFAEQVAHDIRSPLASMNIILKDIQNLPEHQRNIIRSATQRINDIANNLLSNYIKKTDINNSKIVAESIFGMIDMIVSEKRVQHSPQVVEFSINIEDEAHGAFIKVVPVDFKRMLSNLINNAIEAVPSSRKGEINIIVTLDGDYVNLVIKDNGCGIPADLLPKIINEGVSIGKKNGAGLGLSYAIKKIQEWSGTYVIESTVGQGTFLRITLPIALPEKWFAEKILIPNGSTVIVLDDEETIHQVWQSRFEKQNLNSNLDLVDFYIANDLLKSVNEMIYEPSKCIYLIDYELIGAEHTGLDLIKRLGLEKQSYLVTSRYEDELIRYECIKLGVKIVPKLYCAYIPLTILNTAVDFILLDDDVMLRSAWEKRAKVRKKRIACFKASEDLLNYIYLFNKTLPIYIDSDLGGIEKGETVAKKLYNMGYQNIYLSTGHSAEHFSSMSWIKEIVSKDPPF